MDEDTLDQIQAALPVQTSPSLGSEEESDDRAAALAGEDEIEDVDECDTMGNVQAHGNATVVLRNLQRILLTDNMGLNGEERIAAWQNELSAIQETSEKPVRLLVALEGSTGSGKSSLINALLGRGSIVPTSSLQACTSVITEISYHPDPEEFRAEIEFITREDLAKELVILKQDLNETGETLEDKELQSEALSKVKAIYSGIIDFKTAAGRRLDGYEINDLLDLGTACSFLGETHEIVSDNIADFRNEVEKFVRSESRVTQLTEDGDPPTEYWPLIHRVRIFCHSPILENGVVCVDLPGTGDSNSARATMAQKYMQQADAVVLVSEGKRAVDEANLNSWLSDLTTKEQLRLDGMSGNVTIVATKSDEFSVAEIVRNLHLTDTEAFERFEDRHRELMSESDRVAALRGVTKGELAPLNKEKRAIERQIKLLTSATETNDRASPAHSTSTAASGAISGPVSPNKRKMHNQAPASPSKAKKRRTVDGANAVDGAARPITVSEVGEEEEGTSTPAALAKLHERLTELDGQIHKGKLQMAAHENEDAVISRKKTLLQREKKAACALQRNEWIRTHLKALYRSFLEEAGWTDEEKEAIELNIFSVSSNEYSKLASLDEQSEEAAVFSNVKDTEIPRLRSHLRSLADGPHQQRSQSLVRGLIDSLHNIEAFLSVEGRAATKVESMRITFEDGIRELEEELHSFLEQLHTEVQQKIRGSIGNPLEEGVEDAKSRAVEIIAEQARLKCNTLKAVVKRNGNHPKLKSGPKDFNSALCAPVFSALTTKWEQFFRSRAFTEGYADQLENSISDLSIHMSRSWPEAEEEFSNVIARVLVAHRHRVKEAVRRISAEIHARHKEIWRLYQPGLEEALKPTYRKAAAVTGPGSLVAMADILEEDVRVLALSMFDKQAGVLMDGVRELEESVRVMLQKDVDIAVSRIKQSFLPLWQIQDINQSEHLETIEKRAALLRLVKAELVKLEYINNAHEAAQSGAVREDVEMDELSSSDEE